VSFLAPVSNGIHVEKAMPNIAALFKSEISRIARKEVRAETTSLKKASAAHRSEIAALKRQVKELAQALRRAQRSSGRRAEVASDDDAEGGGRSLRFSAKGLASQRKRLGLSARECGLLVGASGQSVYLWETGRARPRAKHVGAIAALRTMGKKQAAARLAELGEKA
jgi:DNA-binding transcriptional regulator YiaG